MKEVLSIIRLGLLFQNAVIRSGKSWWKSVGALIQRPGHPSQKLKTDSATCQLHCRKRDIILGIGETHVSCKWMLEITKKDG